MFMASALNVVAMTDRPAMPGHDDVEVSWSLEKIAPKRTRNSSGRTKLKNAAEGLRQNMRRSRRYWRQASRRRQPRRASSGASAVSSR